MTKEELLNLPTRAWDEEKDYTAIIVVPTDELHDSGWRLMALVGCTSKDGDHCMPTEIAAYCDDIQWNSEGADPTHLKFWDMDCDMFPDTNFIRFHSFTNKFRVGMSLSSTTIKIVKA